MAMNAVEAFETIHRALFEDDERSDQQVMADWDEFSRFLAVPRGLESFDGWKAFLIEDELLGRYIWKGPDHDEGEVLEANLVPGEFDDAIEALVAFIDLAS